MRICDRCSLGFSTNEENTREKTEIVGLADEIQRDRQGLWREEESKQGKNMNEKKGKKATHLANECKTSRDTASVGFT